MKCFYDCHAKHYMDIILLKEKRTDGNPLSKMRPDILAQHSALKKISKD